MQPGFDLRIRTMVKALTETVMPAVDTGNQAAVEQLNIVISCLNMLVEQIDYGHCFESVEANGMADMVDEIVDAVTLPSIDAARSLATEVRTVAQRNDVPISTLREHNRAIRAVISTLIEESFAGTDTVAQQQVQTLVLKHSRAQIGRERAFVAGANFDVFPDSLQTLAEALKESE